MRGVRDFEGIGDLPSTGIQVSSQEHPIQGSMWADYSAMPGQQYIYKIAAMRGTPGTRSDRISDPAGDVPDPFANQSAP